MIMLDKSLRSIGMNRFTLSSSQQKELLVRGQPLLIAVPMRQDCESDQAATQLAREWLVLPANCRVVSAQVQEIEVSAQIAPRGGETLADLLGSILRDDADRSQHRLVCRHVVLMALVRGPEDRHPLKVPQWPGGKINVGAS